MSAEGMPPETVLGRLLKGLVRLALLKPRVTVALGVIGIAVSLYLCSTHLKYHTSRAASGSARGVPPALDEIRQGIRRAGRRGGGGPRRIARGF